ncbi:endonuclease/exonuclease/phosphatase family protein [Streptomyces sp. NPDC046557]|uniref:endonuclease/exonuclease/phosphatase family protein n=1 Tax=Streptomyces sp. NPDC046557 TaxID=3155372 RepID=UPI0034009869
MPWETRLFRKRRALVPAVAGALVCVLGAVYGVHASGQRQDRSADLPSELPSAAAHDARFVTWNMCGVPQWDCKDMAGTARTEELWKLASAANTRAVLLQEVCSGDLSQVAGRLGATWHTSFRPYVTVAKTGDRSPVLCENPDRGSAGFAILAHSELTKVFLLPTPQPKEGVQRGVLCASLAAEDIRVCSAHLTPKGDDRELRGDQLREMVRVSVGKRAVVGGDFNAVPPGQDNPNTWMWPSELYSKLRECDQRGSSRAGRPTHEDGDKIDYLFTSLTRSGCELAPWGVSDHRALVLRVPLGDAPSS